MSRIYLIRHAKPASTWGGDDDDPGLDETGRAQAQAAAAWLLALPADERPTRVVTSPLRRCRETAQPFADALGVIATVEPGVGEIPTPAGLPHAERGAWLAKAMAGRWSAIDGDLDYEAWRGRAVAALEASAGAAVFSHFVAINGVLSRLAGAPEVIVYRPDHAAITVLDLTAGELRLVRRGAEAATGVL
jgi:broad specificity phosphatase PhoE